MVLSCLVVAAGALLGPASGPAPKAVDAALAKRIDDLVARLGHPRFAVREQARKELATLGMPALFPLRRLLASPDPDLAARARECLYELLLNIRVSTLMERLRDKDPAARARAAHGLMEIGHAARAAVPALVRALDDPDPKAWERATYALAAMGADAKPAVPKLIAVVRDTRAGEDRRWFAGNCLRHIGPAAAAEAEPMFLDLLRDYGEGTRLRSIAIAGLGAMGGHDPRVVPALVRLLDEAKGNTHLGAALALGQIGKSPSTVVPALVRMLKNNLGREPKPWNPDGGFEPRYIAIMVLSKFGDAAEPAVPLLAEIVKSPFRDTTVRSAAMDLLTVLGPKAKAAVPALELMQKNDPVHAAEAARVLEAINRPGK